MMVWVCYTFGTVSFDLRLSSARDTLVLLNLFEIYIRRTSGVGFCDLRISLGPYGPLILG